MVTGPVIVGIDESSVSHAAVELARDLARRYELPLLYVHVVPRTGEDERTEQTLKEVDFSEEAEVAIEHGHPADRLVEIARERQASLVVLGNHGPRSSLLGSVSADVSRRAPCPVIVVPPTAENVPRIAPSKTTFEGGLVRMPLGRAA